MWLYRQSIIGAFSCKLLFWIPAPRSPWTGLWNAKADSKYLRIFFMKMARFCWFTIFDWDSLKVFLIIKKCFRGSLYSFVFNLPVHLGIQSNFRRPSQGWRKPLSYVHLKMGGHISEKCTNKTNWIQHIHVGEQFFFPFLNILSCVVVCFQKHFFLAQKLFGIISNPWHIESFKNRFVLDTPV